MLIDQLQDILNSFHLLAPELTLMGGSILLLLVGLITKKSIWISGTFGIVLLVALVFSAGVGDGGLYFSDSIVIGPLEGLVRMLLIASCIWIVFFPNGTNRSMEFYFLIIGVLVGSLFLTISNNLLLIYVVLELTSFSSYLLTNFSFKRKSFEAGLKYLLFGGVSSAAMLYGMSLLYGLSGTLTLSEWSFLAGDILAGLAAVLVLVGLFFKTGIVPFHIWTPSTYEQAPTEAVAILSIVPKIAGFVLLHRVVSSLAFPWMEHLILVAGMATILVGTLGALNQRHVKRLMAYGAIAHSGFFVACLIPNGEVGVVSFVWYALVYAIMNVALFYLVAVLERDELIYIEDFKGLGRRHPFFLCLFLVVLLSLIGLPPTAGFSIKFYLFSALWTEFQSGGDVLIVVYVCVAALSIVFSLFYYLKIPFHSFISVGDSGKSFKPDLFAGFLATISAMSLLGFFFRPEILNKIADHIKFIAW